MTIRIVSKANPQLGIACNVVEVGRDANTGVLAHLSLSSCRDGNYNLVHPSKTSVLIVYPMHGHWAAIQQVTSSAGQIECEPIADDIGLPWWERAVGMTAARVQSAARIRIGIIDRLFDKGRPPAPLAHVDFIDGNSYVQNVLNQLGGGRYQTHGQRVSLVVAARGPAPFTGIASDAKTFFADATFLSSGSLVPGESVDVARIVAGIRRLSQDHDVHLINISCGFSEDDFSIQDDFIALQDYLEEAVDEAADNGCLCVCAGGNTPNEQPPLPARLPLTIGVGGIGLCDVAPPGTLMNHVQSLASQNGVISSNVAGVGRFFHDVTGASSGRGVDVAAPSIGIVMQHAANAVAECRGTSYASPIACSVLACRLSADTKYLNLRGRSRYDHARQLMLTIARDLGLSPALVGHGLPQLA